MSHHLSLPFRLPAQGREFALAAHHPYRLAQVGLGCRAGSRLVVARREEDDTQIVAL